MDFLSLHPRPTLDILVLGAPGSGKRSFCGRLAHDIFPFERDPTEDGQFRRMVQLFPPEAERSFHVLCNWTTILADPKEMNPGILQQMVREHEVFVLLYRTSDRTTFQAIEGLWRDLIAERGDSMSTTWSVGEKDRPWPTSLAPLFGRCQRRQDKVPLSSRWPRWQRRYFCVGCGEELDPTCMLMMK
jgi:hypothetical protein